MARDFRPVERKAPTVTRKIAGTTQPVRKPAADVVLSEQRIRERAFEIYMRRNGGPGDAHSDWVQAERELRQELSGK